jgi:hypothetical protein
MDDKARDATKQNPSSVRLIIHVLPAHRLELAEIQT